jgi:NitT/TauT family transport system ATP-binding protein
VAAWKTRDGPETAERTEDEAPVIVVDQLDHSFMTDTGESLRVLDDIDLDIGAGEFVALIGPSGCGKTTLLNVIAGLERHTGGGTLLVNGAPPAAGTADVGYMLARDSLLPWRRALGNASVVLEMQGVPKEERTARARAALRMVGLEQFERSYPAQLSQGMRQRVALARVFAAEPALVLLDEPFSALDAQTRLNVQDEFLRVWQGRNTTVLLVTHDLSEAVALADRVVIMSRRPGRIKAVHHIQLPRPRLASDASASPEFQSYYETCWNDLRAEVLAR